MVLYVLGYWRRGDRRGAAGCVIGTLGDSAVVEIGDGPALRYGAVVRIGDAPLGGNVVGALVVRYAANIPFMVLI